MADTQKNQKCKLDFKATAHQRIIAAVIFLLIAGLFTVLHLAAKGKIDIARWINPCGFKQQFHWPCPTCSMTTAAVIFASGNILRAFYVQPASALLCSVLVLTAILAFITAVFGIYFNFVKRFITEVKIRYIILAIAVIIAAGWMVTLARTLAQNK
jgi:hypothetical protein